MLRYIPFILLLIGSVPVFGQEVFHYSHQILFTEFKNIDSGYFECVIPSSYPERQAIINFNFSTNPDTVLVKNEHLVGRWDIDHFKGSRILLIHANVISEAYNWEISRLIPELNTQNIDVNQYLKVRFVNDDPFKELFLVAESVKEFSPKNTVKNIYNKFVHRDKEVHSLLKLFSNKHGKQDLFVSICRINQIPARLAQILSTDSNSTEPGYLVEVFLDNRGWIPIDISKFSKDPVIEKEPSHPLFYIAYHDDINIINWYTSGNKSKINLESKFILSDNLDVLYMQAFELYNLNKLSESLTIFKHLKEREPEDYGIHMMIGAIYARANKKELANEYLNNALAFAKFDDEKCAVHYAYANFHARQGNENLALSYLKRALEKCWFSYESVFNDIDLRLLQKNPRFLKLIETLPKDEFFVAPN